VFGFEVCDRRGRWVDCVGAVVDEVNVDMDGVYCVEFWDDIEGVVVAGVYFEGLAEEVNDILKGVVSR